MTAATLTAGLEKAEETETGFADRMLERYMQNQERRAQRYVSSILQNYDDATLTRLGYSRDDLKKASVHWYL